MNEYQGIDVRGKHNLISHFDFASFDSRPYATKLTEGMAIGISDYELELVQDHNDV